MLKNELDKPERVLAALLILNNSSNYIGVLALANLLELTGLPTWQISVINAAVLTPLLFVFAETLPKEYARVTAERNLEPAAKRGAMKGCHNRLVAGLDSIDHVGKKRFGHRLAELLDIRTRNEGPPDAVKHRDAGAVVLREAGERVVEPGPHGLRQGIHRRIVHRDARNAIFNGVANGVCHEPSLPDECLKAGVTRRAV